MQKLAKMFFTISLCVVVLYLATFALIKLNVIPISNNKYNYAYVKTDKLNVRSLPSTNSRVKNQLNKGEHINIRDKKSNWLHINSNQRRISGWVYGNFVNTASQENHLSSILYHWLYWSDLPEKSKFYSIIPIVNILLLVTILIFYPIYIYIFIKTRMLRKLSKKSWLKFNT